MEKTKERRSFTTPPTLSQTPSTTESSQVRKRKTPAGRRIQADIPLDVADYFDDLPALPTARRRSYHVISCDSDDDNSTANLPTT
ncbi:hypothetical protein V6N11_055218 [Hibiscus sabdariffa]|uniref:Uncharacterized protein n=1 Tax=Hibiscus sabdariffa TaxID=183260 RepID=A0ABR2PEM4_9ROSI